MEYRRFEQLVIGASAVLVAGAIAASVHSGGATPVEIAAQLVAILVVGVAVHWGRTGGTLAALVASVAYLAARLPLIADSPTRQTLVLVVSRMVGYLLLGIVGGEVFGRVKYMLAKSQDAAAIDDFSHVFSERFAAHAIRQASGRADRYFEPFSLVLVDLDAEFTGNAHTKRIRSLVRGIANVIRDDVRVIDDVAHMRDGRFLVLLPNTAAAGANVVAARLASTVGSAHGVKEGHVSTTCLSAPQDRAALDTLCAQLDSTTGEEPDQPASGV